MCEFASFMVTADGQVYASNLLGHDGIEAGWDLQPGQYREAEWTEDDYGDSLVVRCGVREHESTWVDKVLARYPSRSALFSSLILGKTDLAVYHLKDGLVHRDGGPAIEYADGTKYWYQHGLQHRVDGPALERPDGSKAWCQCDQLHRDDGPAVEYADGTKFWYQHDQLHRVDGPALEGADGTKLWYQHGKLHRDDGPAVEYADGTKHWYQQDRLMRKE